MPRASLCSCLVYAFLIAGAIQTSAWGAEQLSVTHEEWELWQRHLLPLPQSIEIDSRIRVDRERVLVDVSSDAGVIGARAARELRELIGATSGEPEFEIRLELTDDARLADVPHSDQAYVIEHDGERVLTVRARDARGLYYGSQTLQSLIGARLTDRAVELPLVRVLDYPDFDERGLWNFPDHETMIPRLSSMKMNYGKMHQTEFLPVEKGQPGRVRIDVEMLKEAQTMGFNLVPFITHLNFAGTDTGLFHHYPETAGIGEGAIAGLYQAHQGTEYRPRDQARVPYAAHPTFIRYVTDWMRDIARQGARDISCWLSERPASDQRPETLGVGQFVLEARAFLKAYEEVRKEYPDLRIRLFLSTTTDERYHQILAEAPPEVRIERCCAQPLERVTAEPRDLVRSPLMEYYARQGRWIATYDVPVGAFVQVETPDMKLPMRSAHMLRHYIRQFYDQGYEGAYSMLMISWGLHHETICGYNIAAAAEWEWNVDGRDEREFALAYATREGLPPEAVAEWTDLMGPIEFDVYGSYMPMALSQGWATDMICRRQMPVLGEGIFRYYRSEEDFDRKLEICDRALSIAETIDQDYVNETQLVRSYIALMQTVYRLALLTATSTLETAEDQVRLQDLLGEFRNRGEANVEAIRTWRRNLGPEPEEAWVEERIDRGMNYTRQMVRTVDNYLTSRYSYLLPR